MAFTAACECGLCKIELSRLPTQRMFCHCTICQQVYDRPFADVTMTNPNTLRPPDKPAIIFKKHKKLFALDRGTCTECKRPVLALLQLIPGVKIAFVPSYTLGQMADDIEPSMHIHYRSRLEDFEDSKPKFEGALRSTIACLGPFLSAYRGR